MRKKFRTRKRFKIKKILYIALIIFLIVFFRLYVIKIKLINSNEKMINTILDNSNYYSYNNNNKSNILETISNYINENIFNSPLFFLKSQLNIKTSKLKNELNNNLKVNKVEFLYEQNEPPKVYIYNSHQGENYSMKYLEEYNIVPNVMMAANMLKDKLENININTIVEESDILAYMKQNNLNHAGSYIASRVFLEKAVNKYSSVELFIDLHRDAAPHSATYTSIDGKDYAKVLFVIGLENSNYEKNLEVVTKINNIILDKYPSLTRGIMKKEGYGVNGVYNQDLNSDIILLEMGGNENNIDEINNTLDIIANVIGEYLNEKEQKE